MRLRVWYGPLLLAVFFAALATWSWEKWADVHIDFGAELYTAWRLAEGDALYRDIAYRQGPLPHYLNALWFTLFGVSIRVLALCNLALLAGICVLSWTIFRRGCGAWVATAAILLANVPVRISSLIMLFAAGGLLAAAPMLVRRSSMLPEPLLPPASEKLVQAYARRRLIRARMTLATIMVTVLSHTCLVAVLGLKLTMDVVLLWGVVTIALLAMITIFFFGLERTVSRRIRDLQRLAAECGDSDFEAEVRA